MRKIIIISITVLALLIVTTIVITDLLQNKKTVINPKITPIPTVKYEKISIPPSSKKPAPKEKQINYETILQKIYILSPTEIENLDKLKQKIPYENEDFSVEYSPFLNQIIIYKKTAVADEKISQWLKENNIPEKFKENNLIVITDKPAAEYQDTVEKNVIKNNDKFKVPTPQPTPSQSPTITLSTTPTQPATGADKNLSLITELLKILLNFGYDLNLSTSSSPTSNYPTVYPQLSPSTSIPPSYPQAPLTLTELFNEVGQKVGVPAKILEAVMSIECNSTFNLSAEEVALYSQPGNRLPFCTTNFCSATGPMQMSIGVDERGDTSCVRCGAGYCPNAWASYGGAVNTFGGYQHSPNPFNIRDNVYAAASKLKNDSRASSVTDWTQDEVFRAGERYHGSCSDKYRYVHLGNRTYCEYLWDYYKNK